MALRDVLRAIRNKAEQEKVQAAVFTDRIKNQAQSNAAQVVNTSQNRANQIRKTFQRGYQQAPTNPRNIQQTIQTMRQGAQQATPQPIRQIPQTFRRGYEQTNVGAGRFNPIVGAKLAPQVFNPQTILRTGAGAAAELARLGDTRKNVSFTPGRFTRPLLGTKPIEPISTVLGRGVQTQQRGAQQAGIGSIGQGLAAGGLGVALGLAGGIEAIPGGKQAAKGSKVLAEAATKEAPDVLKYVSNLTAQKELARSGNVAGKFRKGYDKVKAGFVDTLAPVEDRLKAIGKLEGRNVTGQEVVNDLIAKVNGSEARANVFIKENYDNKLVNSTLKDAGLSQDVFKEYLIAKRRIGRLEKTGKDFVVDSDTGRNLTADIALVNQFDEVLQPAANEVYRLRDGIIRERVRSGRISEETARKLLEKDPFYVPAKRVFADDGSDVAFAGGRAVAGSSSTGIKKIGQSAREIDDPIEDLLKQTYEAYKEGAKNTLAKFAKDTIDQGNPLGLRVLADAEDKVTRMKAGQKINELRKNLSELGSEIGKSKTAISRFTNKSKNTEFKINELDSLAAEVLQDEFIPNSKGVKLIERAFTQEKRLFQLAQKEKNEAAKISQLKALAEKRNEAIDELRRIISEARDIRKQPKEKTLTFLEGGNKTVMTADDPAILIALKGLNKDNMNLVTKIGAVFNRTFKAGTTGAFAPLFILKSLARDPLTAIIFGKNGIKNLRSFSPDRFMASIFQTLGKSEIYKEAIKSGAITTSFDNLPRNTKLSLKELEAQGSLKVIPLMLKNPSIGLRKIEDLMSTVERANRLSVYKTIKQLNLKKGMSEEEASLLAAKQSREDLVDFMRSGSSIQSLNSIIPYLNAAIQGNRLLARGVSSPKQAAATAVKFTALAGMPMAATTAYNLSDPDRREAYSKISDYEKESNFIIILPKGVSEDGTVSVVKIPIQPGFNNLLTPIRKATEKAYDVGGEMEFKDYANALLGVTTPFSVDNTPTATAKRNLSQILPTAIKPATEVALNSKTFPYDKPSPVVPEYMLNRSPEKQKFENTPEIAVKIGELTGTSPLAVNYLLEQYLNTPYKMLANATDRALIGIGATTKEAGGKSFTEDFKNTFLRSSGKGEAQAMEEKILKYKQEGADTSADISEQAHEIYAELDGLKPEVAVRKLNLIKKDNPELAKKVMDVRKAKLLDLSSEEYSIKELGVEDGTRARFIYNELLKGKDTQEQKAILDEYKSKKIISKKVFEQLLELKKNEAKD
jgi:Mg2+ and Co2+ transporter CorA